MNVIEMCGCVLHLGVHELGFFQLYTVHQSDRVLLSTALFCTMINVFGMGLCTNSDRGTADL